MEWQPLASDLDVQNLLQIFGGFHDSCVTEVFMRTRESVDEKLSMGFNNSPIVRMTFQRQFRNPISIEIQFDGVEDFNWVNASFSTDTGMTVITDGVLLFKDGLLYWADDMDWHNDEFKANVRWLSAHAGKWRVVV